MRTRKFFLRIWHKLVLGRKRWRTIIRGGIKYRVQYQGIGRILIVNINEGHELAQLSYFRKQLQLLRSELLIDVGAHMGTYALPLAASGLLKKVYAVEGSKDMFQLLCENVALNALGNVVETVNAVVSNTNGEVLFYEYADEFLSGWSGQKESLGHHQASGKILERKVQSNTLDQLLSNHHISSKSIALKVDVEGHELCVLQGAAQLLKNNRVLLQIEIWPENSSNLNWLHKNGFSIMMRIEDDYFLRNF